MLTWFLVLHPIFGLRKVLPLVRFSRSDAEATESPGIQDDAAALLLEESAEAQAPEGDAAGDLHDDFGTADLLQILDEAEQNYMKNQIVSAAERVVDAELFGWGATTRPFVRMSLRNSYHDFLIDGVPGTQHVVFEPRLTLYSDGLIQLDLAVRAEGPLSTSQVLDLMWGPAPRVVSSEVSAPLYEGTDWEGLADLRDGAMDMGEPLASFQHAVPVSMGDILQVHMQAVLRAMKWRGPVQWLNYPVAFTKPGACCSATRWRENHAHDVHLLAIRGQFRSRIASHVASPADLSMRSTHSLFATLGSAIYIRWEGAIPAAIRELNTVLVFEFALQLYLRLVTMESRVARLRLGDRELRVRYREALRLFSELRQGSLRAGEARDIARAVLRELGAEEIRPTIETALTLAGTAHDTVSAARAARRSWWITVLATLIAALVAVPALQQLLLSLPATPSEPIGAVLLAPLNWASDLAFWGPWALMGATIAVVVGAVALGWVVRHRPRHVPGIRRGFAWPTRFTVKSIDGSEDPTGGGDETASEVSDAPERTEADQA
ncbi:hypothetical protein QSU92_08650 [Microbacterium sp. ET2]|uniref:hypothetical protein n=1 Tax=Microbacterium albipurpureum TaxID=3050384 RepID=UPI00259CF496|nr:hypothetical protein [Microbacterium sp. ET2 (Ac-2212)]WJL97210.1 hypothetical protein QSU92_08650 [Microbacterium sp. ET2 (Ac-2212)]